MGGWGEGSSLSRWVGVGGNFWRGGLVVEALGGLKQQQ